ncbi:MAG: hypothetical protein HYY46_18655 [Deltaproteobacteria bacterium]|nr:hypothetical protein [Deltaproteobacteria bacterium]
MKQAVRVIVNDRLYEEEVEPRLLLPYFLRENVGLTGTRGHQELRNSPNREAAKRKRMAAP